MTSKVHAKSTLGPMFAYVSDVERSTDIGMSLASARRCVSFSVEAGEKTGRSDKRVSSVVAGPKGFSRLLGLAETNGPSESGP